MTAYYSKSSLNCLNKLVDEYNNTSITNHCSMCSKT